MQYDVFISYSRKDIEVAKRICKAFDEVGITYFIDLQGISGGFEFPTVLAEAIIESKIFLYLASNNSYESRFTQSEITFAFSEKPKGSILPYIIDGSTMPPALRFVFSNINWRRIEEHPIETVLMDDLLHLLNKKREQHSESHARTASNPSPTPSNKKTYTVNGVSFTMINVKGGSFMMGSPDNDSDANDSEKPIHKVTLSDFSIGETQVTQELWNAVMGNNPSNCKGNVQRPVDTVSWYDCQEFILKLNSLTGAIFRLPTEAEWEYAARGGSQSRDYKYSGSNDIDSVACYDDNYSSLNDFTHPVKSKLPNELGLYDMSGNVCEWCADWYDDSYYSNCTSSNPTGALSGSRRVLRGGCGLYIAKGCRVANRDSFLPDSPMWIFGLRVAQ